MNIMDEYQLEVPRTCVRLKEFSTGFEIPHDALATIKTGSKKGDAEQFIMDTYDFSRDQVQELLGVTKECKDYMKSFEGGKFTLAGKPYIEGNTMNAAYCRAGELLISSIEESSKSLGSPVVITGEYLMGTSWAGSH